MNSSSPSGMQGKCGEVILGSLTQSFQSVQTLDISLVKVAGRVAMTMGIVKIFQPLLYTIVHLTQRGQVKSDSWR